MIKHRYGDRYLHNEALEIIFRRLELSQALLLIGHFIFAICFPVCALLSGGPFTFIQCNQRNNKHGIIHPSFYRHVERTVETTTQTTRQMSCQPTSGYKRYLTTPTQNA
ncbi:hypothetical protein T4D_1224 [Trichinella pseudospiralis]|uniref:Uncharacterized protein n=1 Tax=Trichinella pseudospiralis TaxID=6337 RepID=A0A0V1FHY4_TRIPS|nr:hypothetical protein T4D_1224 [Trichinella pseudospiralis]